MSKRNEKKITDILHDNTTQLGTLLKKVFQYNQLEPNLEDYLPKDVAPHVRLGNYKGGKLTLLVESGSWATKLHFLVPTLREALRKNPHWAGLRNIDIKVAPHLIEQAPKPEPKPEPPREISQQSKECLKKAATELSDTPENQALQSVLRRLAGESDSH